MIQNLLIHFSCKMLALIGRLYPNSLELAQSYPASKFYRSRLYIRQPLVAI